MMGLSKFRIGLFIYVSISQISCDAYRFPEFGAETVSIDMSYDGNRAGTIQNPLMNQTNNGGESYIVFSNLPPVIWLSLQYTFESCQPLPFKITALQDQKVTFKTTPCNATSEAIINRDHYTDALTFTLKATTQIPEFQLKYHIKSDVSILRREPNTVPVTISTPSGYIMSHLNFNFGIDIPTAMISQSPKSASYLRQIDSSLILTLPPATTHVHLHFIHFDIGNDNVTVCEQTQSDNTVDQFAVYNGDTALYKCAGGNSPPPNQTFTITTDNSTLRFTFKSSSAIPENTTGFTGFLLRYKVTGCKVDYPNATIKRQHDSVSGFILSCADNVTTDEIICIDGTWSGRLLPSQCPGPSPPVHSTMVTKIAPNGSTKASEPTEATGSTRSTDSNGSKDTAGSTGNTSTTQAASSNSYNTTVTRTDMMIRTKSIQPFQWEMIHTVSVAAGGGGLVLIIIIVILVVIICRNKSHSREQIKQKDGEDVDTSERPDNDYHCLEGNTDECDESHVQPGNNGDSDGDGYAMVDIAENRRATEAAENEDQKPSSELIDPSDGGPYSTVNIISDESIPPPEDNTLNAAEDKDTQVEECSTTLPDCTDKSEGELDCERNDDDVETYANQATIKRQNTEKQKGTSDLYGSILAENKKKPVSNEQPKTSTDSEMVDNDLYGT